MLYVVKKSSFNAEPTQAIVDDVESGGTKSLIAQALRLGDIKAETDPLLLGPAEMKAAYDKLTEEDQQVLLNTKVCSCCCGAPLPFLMRLVELLWQLLRHRCPCRSVVCTYESM